MNPADSTPARLAAYVGDYWSEELQVVAHLEIHDGKLANRERSGTWLYFLPSGADRFDAEGMGIVLEFTRNPASEVTEVKASASRVRHIRYTRVTLPKSWLFANSPSSCRPEVKLTATAVLAPGAAGQR